MGAKNGIQKKPIKKPKADYDFKPSKGNNDIYFANHFVE